MSNDIELPDPITEAEALSTLLKSELWDMHKHVGWYSAPEKRFREYGVMLIQAMITARDEQWRAFLADREKRAQAAQGTASVAPWLKQTPLPPEVAEILRNTNMVDLYATEASKPVQAEAPSDKQIAMAMLAVDDPLAWGKLGAEGGKAMIKQFVAALFATKQAEAPATSNAGGWVRGHMGSTPDGGIDDHDEPADQEPNLVRAVDDWFAQNTGLGGCSNKDVAELAAIFYGVTFEGGRESVDDALAIVDSFGPGIEGLNDTYARQVLLAQEVRRLHADYIKAVQGRQEWRDAAIRARLGGQIEANLRKALRLARDHIDMNALRVSHCKDAEAIDNALAGRVPE